MTYHSKKLRESAKDCPECMSCGRINYDGHQLCLAHSNSLEHGRGVGHKSDDRHGAIVCHECHELIDGRAGGYEKGDKRAMHAAAWMGTMRWWINNNWLVCK